MKTLRACLKSLFRRKISEFQANIVKMRNNNGVISTNVEQCAGEIMKLQQNTEILDRF